MRSYPVVSRRKFLSRFALSASVAVASRPSRAWVTETHHPQAAALVARTIGIDTHNHIDVPLAASGSPGPDLDLSGEMKQSGLSAICMTFATDYQPGDPYERFRNGLAAMDSVLERNEIKRSLSSADIRSAHQHRQPTVVQSVEGCHFLQGQLARVEEAYQRGLRHLGLLHDSDASVPLGDVYTNPPRFGGLTEFGASVVKECNRLGILVDLAHANAQTTEAALKVATRPVIISHTGLDTRLGSDPRMAQIMRPRLISREQATMVARAGGLIGVWTHLADSPEQYAQNIRALVEVIGSDHVCLGTDTKLALPPSRSDSGDQERPRVGQGTNLAWADQRDGFYFAVVDAMLKTGFTQDEIGKIGGGNFLRVFAQAVGK